MAGSESKNECSLSETMKPVTIPNEKTKPVPVSLQAKTNHQKCVSDINQQDNSLILKDSSNFNMSLNRFTLE